MIGGKNFLALDLLHDLFISTKSLYVSVDPQRRSVMKPRFPAFVEVDEIGEGA